MIKNNNSTKVPSFRIAHCGNFPNYRLNGVSFHDRNIIYLVSVGKEKFENKWVQRFINFVKEVKPKKVIIVVADTLQRFNIEIDESLEPKQALNESIYRGQLWAERYNFYFSNLAIDYEFIHWETLKKDKNFKHYHDEIQQLNKESDEFKKALSTSSKEYTNRPSRLNSGAIPEDLKAQENSCQFLIEECAIFRVLAKNKDNLAIVYPGAVTDILGYAIRYINENYREKNNFFYWLDMRPTKDNKNKKNIDSQQIEIKNENKDRDVIATAIRPSFFKSPSLEERQLSQLSLDSSACVEKPSHYFRA